MTDDEAGAAECKAIVEEMVTASLQMLRERFPGTSNEELLAGVLLLRERLRPQVSMTQRIENVRYFYDGRARE